MKEFEIHAGWLNPPEKIGKCRINSARGKETISFAYDEKWLSIHPSFKLDPDVISMAGWQYPPSNKPCFGFLSDISPDSWGRKLMDRREAILAKEESRPKRKLLDSDYIFGVHDQGRIGGIRLFDPDNNEYISSRKTLAAPPMETLRKLEQSSLGFEASADRESEKWLKNLLDPGSSLGGARPKANVIDEEGNLWIAKFPSKNDEIDVGAWEMVSHNLALKCGLNVPDARFMRFSDAGTTFLSKRFDRNGSNRVHYASAMTVLGCTDAQEDQMSYLDIAEAIEQISLNPNKDLKELWNRIVFNICISNTDDHLRNHGFILDGDSWRLSPVFDINPNTDKDSLSLIIAETDRKDVQEAISAAGYFRLSEKDARDQALKLQRIVCDSWKNEAVRCGISNSEIEQMKIAFEHLCSDRIVSFSAGFRVSSLPFKGD